MRRAALVTGATVVGLLWVVTFRVSPHTAGVATTAPEADSGPPPASPAPSATPGANGTFTGADMPNRFGDVQVRVVIRDGRITDVSALQLPSDRAESAYISTVAGPMLRAEALKAQSAKIDIISGATYTSVSYARSLESALQQAHLG